LLLDNNGNLVLCQHGDRRMARMDAPVNNPQPKFVSLAASYQGNVSAVLTTQHSIVKENYS
jgi:gluconolactonase